MKAVLIVIMCMIILVGTAVIIPSVSAELSYGEPIYDNNGKTITTTGGDTNKYGIQIIALKNISIDVVTSSSSSVATTTYIIDQAGTILASAPIVDFNATFTGRVNLTLNDTVDIVNDAGGAFFINVFAGGGGFPISQTNIRWNQSASTCAPSCSHGQVYWNEIQAVTSSPQVSLDIKQSYPADSVSYINASVPIGCNYTSSGGNLTYTKLLVYNSSNSLSYSNEETGINNQTYTKSWITSYLNKDNYNWSCSGNLTNQNFITGNRSFTITNVIANNQSYNTTTYDTATESYSLNITTNGTTTPTANLYYNGTAYASTVSGTSPNFIISNSLTHSTIGTNKNFFWSINYGSSNINTTTLYQNVSAISFALCNVTNNVTYMNLTFADESTLTAMNGSIDTSTWIYYLGDGTVTKSYIYINSSVDNPNQAFCFSPADRTLHKSVTLQYSFTGYPQRRWDDTADLTNTTTNRILYMLSSSVGIYSTYSVLNQLGTPVPGVTVTAQRQISGTWFIVEQGVTDSAGAVTFWLNPNFDHRLSFVKSGFTSETVTIRPSSSTYTVTISDSSQTTADFNSSLQGITWIYYSNSTTTNLLANTNYLFTANFSSNLSNIVNCKMEMLDNKSIVLGTVVGCSAIGGSISQTINTGINPNLRMRLSLDIGSGYQVIDADAYWIILSLNIPSRGTIFGFITYSRDLSQWGTGQRGEFSRILLFFIILFCVLAWVSYNTNYDFVTSGGVIMLMMPIIWICSLAGFFNLNYISSAQIGGATMAAFMNKYTIALIASCFSIGYFLNYRAAQGG